MSTKIKTPSPIERIADALSKDEGPLDMIAYELKSLGSLDDVAEAVRNIPTVDTEIIAGAITDVVETISRVGYNLIEAIAELSNAIKPPEGPYPDRIAGGKGKLVRETIVAAEPGWSLLEDRWNGDYDDEPELCHVGKIRIIAWRIAVYKPGGRPDFDTYIEPIVADDGGQYDNSRIINIYEDPAGRGFSCSTLYTDLLQWHASTKRMQSNWNAKQIPRARWSIET